MKKILDLLWEEMGQAFEAAGYDPALGKVTVSNRPDLCEYQCNGAMAGAKQYHKAPLVFARDVADRIIFMDEGVIVEQGDARQVIDHPKEERTRQFLTKY